MLLLELRWLELSSPTSLLCSLCSLAPTFPPFCRLEFSRSFFRTYFRPSRFIYQLNSSHSSFAVDPSPEVRVSGSENPNPDGQDVDMSGTQDETNDRNAANTGNETGGRNEGEGEQQSQQDAALPDAPAERADPTPAEPPTPAKKPQGLGFLE